MTNPISIKTDRHTYAPTDEVRVTVTNATSQGIFTTAGKADCTILSLQEKTAEGWRDSSALPCMHAESGSNPEGADVMHIAPGATYSATIHLESDSGAPLARGTYRFALAYSTFTVPPPRLAGGMGDDMGGGQQSRNAGPDGLPVPLGRGAQRPPVIAVYSPEWQVT
jgi:hypothetical protein